MGSWNLGVYPPTEALVKRRLVTRCSGSDEVDLVDCVRSKDESAARRTYAPRAMDLDLFSTDLDFNAALAVLHALLGRRVTLDAGPPYSPAMWRCLYSRGELSAGWDGNAGSDDAVEGVAWFRVGGSDGVGFCLDAEMFSGGWANPDGSALTVEQGGVELSVAVEPLRP